MTLTGNAVIDEAALKEVEDGGFVSSLISQNATVACNTLTDKSLLWQAQAYGTNKAGYKGIVIIARHPRTGAVHTAIATGSDSGIGDNCDSVAAGSNFKAKLQEANFSTDEPITFCVKSDEASVVRGVKIAADGANSAAVSILTEEESREAHCE